MCKNLWPSSLAAICKRHGHYILEVLITSYSLWGICGTFTLGLPLLNCFKNRHLLLVIYVMIVLDRCLLFWKIKDRMWYSVTITLWHCCCRNVIRSICFSDNLSVIVEMRMGSCHCQYSYHRFTSQLLFWFPQKQFFFVCQSCHRLYYVRIVRDK